MWQCDRNNRLTRSRPQLFLGPTIDCLRKNLAEPFTTGFYGVIQILLITPALYRHIYVIWNIADSDQDFNFEIRIFDNLHTRIKKKFLEPIKNKSNSKQCPSSTSILVVGSFETNRYYEYSCSQQFTVGPLLRLYS